MTRLLATLAVLASLAGCAADPLPDAARVADPSAFGGYPDAELGAATTAAWMFSEPSRSRTDPVDAARAVAGIDFLAGDLYANPRWVGLSPLIKLQMLQARTQVRAALGIAPGARSQDVVDLLVRASTAMVFHDDAGALSILAAPLFTLGAQATFARLHDLPSVTVANVATQRFQASFFGAGRGGCMSCG